MLMAGDFDCTTERPNECDLFVSIRVDSQFKIALKFKSLISENLSQHLQQVIPVISPEHSARIRGSTIRPQGFGEQCVWEFQTANGREYTRISTVCRAKPEVRL